MSDWLDKSNELRESLQALADKLYDLGCSFSHTGNNQMKSVMFRYANKLEEIKDGFTEITSTVVNEELKRAQESTANVLMTALAIAKEKGNDVA